MYHLIMNDTSLRPDLSWPRAEWYFTDETADSLAASVTGAVLCVGTPTVATALRRTGKEVHLVDSSPWVSRRLDLGGVKFLCADFESYFPERPFDCVVIDPPWYFPMMSEWLSLAASMIVPGGLLLFPLLDKDTRPSASLERQALVDLADRIGSSEMHVGELRYSIPRFEYCAFLASGSQLKRPWRCADLMELRVAASPERPRIRRRRSDWIEFELGDQLVAVRRKPRGLASTAGPILEGVPGLVDNTMDTVSRRDHRWKMIDVWFSNHRVAITRDHRRLISVLSSIGEIEPAFRDIRSEPFEASNKELALLERWIHV